MQAFLLTGQRSRQAACDVIMQAPAYSTATIKPQKRSDEQNAKLWVMLSDISRAKPQGRVHIPEVWKCLFMAACGHQVQFEMGLDGRPFPTGFKSSRLSKNEMMDLITFVQQWGDEQGVKWSNEVTA
jgi:hypothetical protein